MAWIFSLQSNLDRQKLIVFFTTAFLFSTLHANRTAWAYVKPSVPLRDVKLAWFDCAFLSAYAIGLYLNGWLGDRLKLKTVITTGMIFTVLALTIFSYSFLWNHQSMSLGVILFGVNGLAQSTAFPGFLTVLSNWFPAEQRGVIFGTWLTNVSFGNILGQQLGKGMIDIYQYRWPYVIVMCAGLTAFMTCVMHYVLHIKPSDIGLSIKSAGTPELDKAEDAEEEIQIIENSPAKQSATQVQKFEAAEARPIGFIEAWLQPGVVPYAFVCACVKSANQALLFGLPTYLKLELGFSRETAELLASYELGHLLGVIAFGFLSDRIKNKGKLMSTSLYGAVIIFFAINFIKSKQYFYTYMFLFFFGGMLLGGPSSLLGGVIASDLSGSEDRGDHYPKVKSSSTIFGIIDGSGTIGAAALQPILPTIRSYSFILYTALLLSAAILTPYASEQAHRKYSPKKLMEGKGELVTDETVGPYI